MRSKTMVVFGLVCVSVCCLTVQTLAAPQGATAIRSGNWEDEETWQGGNLPGPVDGAEIPSGLVVTITREGPKIIPWLKNDGTLQGKDGGNGQNGITVRLVMQNSAIASMNNGTIQGGKGGAGGGHGGSVKIKCSRESFLNLAEGKIYGGDGGPGAGDVNAGPGGSVRVEVRAKGKTLTNDGLIQGGSGGHVSQGAASGGNGGAIDLKYVEKLVNRRDGKIIGGNGGSSPGGRGGKGGNVELNKQGEKEDDGEIIPGEGGAGGRPGGDGEIKPLSVSIPTLTEWGLIGLAMLLAGSLAWMIRNREVSNASASR